MDVILLGSLAVILAGVLFLVMQIMKLSRSQGDARTRIDVAIADNPQRRAPRVVGGQRRGGNTGGARRRGGRRMEDSDGEDAPGQNPGAWAMDDDEDLEGEDDFAIGADGKRLGKKKIAKLQAKEEKKMMREDEIREREERKKREQDREKDRAKDIVKREEEEKIEAEKIRAEKEEKERQEHEEYLKLKESFAIEEEGFDENESLQSENMLLDFINYIKRMKVVNMDELASHFKLKSQDVVDRIQTLVADETLTGVIDDRGKFIYISTDELSAVAKFINQRGRVSIHELAQYSNTLIKLESQIEVS